MHADHRRELAVIPVCYGRGRTAAAQRAHNERTGSAHDRRREESKKRNPSCIRRCSGGAGFPFGEGKAGRRRGAHRFRTRYEQGPQICRTRYRGGARTRTGVSDGDQTCPHGAAAGVVQSRVGRLRLQAREGRGCGRLSGHQRTIRVPCVCYLPGCPTGSGAQARPCGAGQDAEDADRLAVRAAMGGRGGRTAPACAGCGPWPSAWRSRHRHTDAGTAR